MPGLTAAAISESPLHKGAGLQPSGTGRAFKGLGVAKWYCRRDSIGDTFVQRGPLTPTLR